MRLKRGLSVASIAFVTAFAGVSGIECPARADGDAPTVDSAAEARQQYKMGTDAFAAKRYSEAASHFEAAASFKANAVALYTAAIAWDLASRPERAADAYARSLEVSGLDAKQTSTAKDRVSSLEKTLGTVVVTAPDGWKVQLDTLTEVGTPARLHAFAGVHTLSVRAANKPIERRDVTLDGGKVSNLELKDEPKPPPKVEPPPVVEKPPPPPPPVDLTPARLRDPFWTTFKVVGVGITGLGVAVLGGAVVLGTSATDAKDAYNGAPTRLGYDHASSLQTWTNVAIISGAVLVVGGIALIVIPIGDHGETHTKIGIGPSGMSVGGTF